MRRLTLWALAGAAMLSGCDTSPTQVPPVSGVHQAIIELDGEARFDLPFLAYVKEEFEVTIYSWRGVGLGRMVVETRVSNTEEGVLIEPFDEYFSEDLAPGVPDQVSRTVTVSFQESGTRWFEIRGRAMPGFEEITRRFSVNVLPPP